MRELNFKSGNLNFENKINFLRTKSILLNKIFVVSLSPKSAGLYLIELLESDFLGVFSEESSTDVHVVLSDDTIVGSGNSAASATFTVSSGVGVPDVLMSHFEQRFF